MGAPVSEPMVYLDGDWVPMRDFASAARLVGATTMGEVYGVPVGSSGEYAVGWDMGDPHGSIHVVIIDSPNETPPSLP